MDPVVLLRMQRDARCFWIELDEPPRRALQVRRPSRSELERWKDSEGNLSRVEGIAAQVVVDWRGFTEADLLGADMAPADPQPFAKENFAEWLRDRTNVQADVSNAAIDALNKAVAAEAEAAKNSSAS